METMVKSDRRRTDAAITEDLASATSADPRRSHTQAVRSFGGEGGGRKGREGEGERESEGKGKKGSCLVCMRERDTGFLVQREGEAGHRQMQAVQLERQRRRERERGWGERDGQSQAVARI